MTFFATICPTRLYRGDGLKPLAAEPFCMVADSVLRATLGFQRGPGVCRTANDSRGTIATLLAFFVAVITADAQCVEGLPAYILTGFPYTLTGFAEGGTSPLT